MSMMVSAIGTPYEIDMDGKIVFFEDVGEDMEVIDNILLHFKLAGKLDRVKGIIFGRMVDCHDVSGKKYKIKDVVNDILGDMDIPVIYGFPSGHSRGRGANVTIPMGVKVRMSAGKKPAVIFLASGVK